MAILTYVHAITTHRRQGGSAEVDFMKNINASIIPYVAI